jgi:hypothetical protein
VYIHRGNNVLTISPGARFIIGIVITTAIAISAGTIHLTHAIPDAWIPVVIAWSGIIAVVGSAIQTSLQGLGLTNANRIAAAAPLSATDKIAIAASAPEVSQIVTTAAIANAAGPLGDGAKVVSK